MVDIVDHMEESASAIGKRRPSFLVGVAISVLFLTTAAAIFLSIVVAYVGFLDAPYSDQWRFADLDRLLPDLLKRNNEHPIVTGRLAFWLDATWFDHRGRLQQALTFVALVCQAPILAWVAWRSGVKRPILLVGLPALVIVLSLRGFENLILPFNVSYVPAFTFALLAFAAFADFLERKSIAALTVSFASAALSVVSLANGALAPTLMAVMALAAGRWLTAFSTGVIAAAAWIWLLAEPSLGTNAGFASFAASPEIVRFFLAGVGSVIGGPWNPVSGAALSAGGSVAAGAVISVLAALALLFVAVRRRRSPFFLALGAIILFALATTAGTAISRFVMGPDLATSSRYHVNVGLLWIAVFVVWLDIFKPLSPKFAGRSGWLMTAGAAALFAWVATSGYLLNVLSVFHRRQIEGTVTLISGAKDDAPLMFLLGLEPLDKAIAGARTLKEHQAWLFADAATRRMGDALTSLEATASSCGVSKWTAPAPGAADRIARGVFARSFKTEGARHILITDAAGRIVGYGRVPRRPSDLNPFRRSGDMIDWTGSIPAGANMPLRAWLSDADAVRCELGPNG